MGLRLIMQYLLKLRSYSFLDEDQSVKRAEDKRMGKVESTGNESLAFKTSFHYFTCLVLCKIEFTQLTLGYQSQFPTKLEKLWDMCVIHKSTKGRWGEKTGSQRKYWEEGERWIFKNQLFSQHKGLIKADMRNSYCCLRKKFILLYLEASLKRCTYFVLLANNRQGTWQRYKSITWAFPLNLMLYQRQRANLGCSWWALRKRPVFS